MANTRRLAFLEIGTIARPHGITGEVKVQTSPEYLDVLQHVTRVYLDGSTQATEIKGYRVHQKSALLKLEGVNTRNDAEAMRGTRVAIRVRELPSLPEGEYYSHDLVGLRVVDETGRQLGELGEVLATGSNDVYIVRTAEGKELLLPAIESVIRKIDLVAQVMTVVVPEGLSG